MSSAPTPSGPPYDTLLTDRRKQQLVADALSNPDAQPHERLYDALGPNTHRNLQIAADRNLRRSWADSISGAEPRISQIPPIRDNRWVPPALFISGMAFIAFGGWLWNYKAERNAALSEVTMGELPSAQQISVQEEEERAPADPSSPLDNETGRAGPGSVAESSPTAKVASLPAEAHPIGAPRLSQMSSSPGTSPVAGPSAGSGASASSVRPSEPPRKPLPAKTSLSADQSIFTEAPF